MGKFKSFEEIISWQKSRMFNKQIYTLTDKPEFKRDFDFVRQIRRASLSISTNIAEGYERRTDREFAHFLFIAKGSAAEVRSLLYLANDLGYVKDQDFEQLKDEVSQISKYISSFIKYLNVQS